MTFGSVTCSRTTGSPSASRFAYVVVEVRKLKAVGLAARVLHGVRAGVVATQGHHGLAGETQRVPPNGLSPRLARPSLSNNGF
jgi:hypothetical protein